MNIIIKILCSSLVLVVQMVKNLPTMQETWVPSLAWEDPLEKEMVTHSSILAWGTTFASSNTLQEQQEGRKAQC